MQSIRSWGRQSLLAVTSCLLLGGTSAIAEPLAGTWATQDASTHVRFEACDTQTCGRIVWLKDPLDPETGKDWRDKFNPDDALKRRPLVGLVIVSGISERAPGTWVAELYNPEDGRSYTGSIRARDAGRLEVKGCALAGLICETEVWTRVP